MALTFCPELSYILGWCMMLYTNAYSNETVGPTVREGDDMLWRITSTGLLRFTERDRMLFIMP